MATINKIPNCPPLRFPEFSDDWQIVPLKGMCELYSGNTPDRTNEAYFNGDINWFSSGELKDRYLHMSNEKISQQAVESVGLKILPPNTLVIAIYGLEASGVRGNCAIIGTSGTISQACMAFIPKVGVMNEYLYSWYQRFGNYIGLKYAQGTKQQNLSSDIIGNLSVAHPTLKEQSKIVCFFRLIDEHIANLSETIKELKTQKAGLLNKLFSQKLRFPDFDDEWRVTTLGTILSLAPQIPIDKPCIKDIISVKLHGKGISRTSATTLNLGATQYYLRRVGQLIYGKQNFHNGAIALIPKEYDNGITSKDIPSFVFDTTKSSPKYVLAYLLRTKYYEATEVYTTGTGSKRLKEDSFFSLPISLPSLEEQKKIADFLSLIDERIEVEEQLLQQYEKQKRYLLKQMFV